MTEQEQNEKFPIVTFIATPPAKTSATTDDPDVDDPGFITNVTATLKESGAGAQPEGQVLRGGSHYLVEVSSLAEVDSWLFAHLHPNGIAIDKRIRVQFIGHASSGRLELGATWLKDKRHTNGAYMELTSNPEPLKLFSTYTGQIEEVVLAGCDVGLWLTNGWPVNGRALMFTLAEMWHCKVRGAIGYINESHFKSGWYKGPAVGWRWSYENRQAQMLDPEMLELEPIQDDGKRIEKPTEIHVGDYELEPSESTTLVNYFTTHVPEGVKLAARDLPIKMIYPTRTVSGYLIGGARHLATSDGTFTNQSKQRDTAFARLIAKIIRRNVLQ